MWFNVVNSNFFVPGSVVLNGFVTRAKGSWWFNVPSGQFILIPCDEACFAIASDLPSNVDLPDSTSKLETRT